MTTHTPRAPRFLLAACLSSALALGACGGGAEVALIPLFEFGFTGTTTGNVGVGVFFLPDKPTTTSGTFDSVNMNVDTIVGQLHYGGSWSGCSFSLAIAADSAANVQAPIAATYMGSFQGNDTLQLKPTSGAGLPTITLKRQGTGTRQTGC